MDGGIKVLETARMTEYTRDGKRHRVGGPAVTLRYENGKIEYKGWYQNGVRTRQNDQPAEIQYGEDGRIIGRAWFKDGLLGRDKDNPSGISVVNFPPVSNLEVASSDMWRDRAQTYKEWRKNGRFHREKGPARMWIDSNFNTTSESYWWNGRQVSEDEHAALVTSTAEDILGAHFNGR